jgi:ABC-type antimicrobial peptide transport system permease subunit
LLRLAGLGIWALSGLPLSLTLAQNPTLLGATSHQLWLVCCLVFGGAFAVLLYGVGPLDPIPFAVIPVLLLGVSLAEGYVPARRAIRIDPMIALRLE